MKDTGDLFSKICDMDNLRKAHKNAKRGKGWYAEVKRIEKDLDHYLRRLQENLIEHRYHTSDYETFIRKEGNKEREIYKLPYYPDRICQWAILQVIEPYLLNSMTKDTYSAIPIIMTEKEIRSKVVEIAKGWLGCKESDGSHKKIIDTYNACKPLPRSYAVKYTDAWCATFASAVGIKAGLTDIIPRECSCNQFIQLAKNMGIWVENDAYTPSAGDMILYDWDDNGVGDNTGSADHIGIVVSVSGGVIKVIEGNKSNAVGYRDLAVNGKYIRGFVTPKYSSKATKEEAPKPSGNGGGSYNIGDIVNFTGCLHYTSSTASGVAYGCKAGQAKVTNKAEGAVHPYHLQAISGKGSTVYGWVNAGDISGKTGGGWIVNTFSDKFF